MYVPALQGSPPLEVGHPNYQPPKRSTKDFGDRLDEFSFAVISLSLRALATEPHLWATFHEDNKNLIFRQNDFQEPDASPVFQAIANIPDDETRELCDRLIRQCHGKEQDAKQELDIQDSQSSVELLPRKALLWGLFGFVLLVTVGGIWLLVQKNPTTNPVTNPPEPKPTIATITTPPKPPNSTTPPPDQPVKLTPITASALLEQYAKGRRDFSYVQLTGTQGDRLQGQDLRNINLSNSTLEGGNFRQLILKNANLNSIKLIKGDLRGSDLSNASLIDANLALSNLSEANLSQASLLRTNLAQSKLGSAILQKTELMKSNLSEADLNAANLSGANLALANLRKTNLTKANLRESNLAAANLDEAILENADLTTADLRSAELRITNFTNANLSGANLTAANLNLVELAGANLTGVNLRNVTIKDLGSIESADFTNTLNLASNVRQYLCTLASGNIAETGIPTKISLNCSP